MASPSGSSFALSVPAAQAAIIHLFNAAGPAAPTNVIATTGNSQATLTWSNSPGATGYILQRSGIQGGPYTTIASALTTNSYADTGLTNGLSYYYVVAATNNSGIGPQSVEAVAAPANLPPLAPVLTVVPGDSLVALNWNIVSGATNYVVLSSSSSGGPYSTNTFTATASYLNTGLSNGTIYYYVVFATGPYGQSALSTEVSAIPFIGPQFSWTNTITAAAQGWNTAANWSNGVAFPNNAQAVAIINSAISASQTINLNQAVTIGELNLGASGGGASFNLAANGGALTLNNSPGTASVLQLASSRGDTISAPLNVNGDLNVANASASALTLSGGVSSTNNLLVDSGTGDSGTVILGGVNAFTGVTIAHGTLQLANSLVLQNATLNYNSGNLGFNGITSATLGGLNGTQNLGLVNVASTAVALTVGNINSNMIYSGSFTGGGSLTKVGTGTLILNGTNTQCGNVTVTGGILQLNGGSMSNAIVTVSGGTAIQFYVHGGSLNSSALSTVGANGSTGGTFLQDGGVANFNGGIQMANNSGTDLRISNGVFTASSITVPKSYTGVGVNFNDGLIFNGGTATVSGNILLANNSSEASMSVGSGTVTVGGNIILGQQTSAGRGGHLQVTGESLTDLDTTNGLVFISPTSAGQSSTATFLGGVSSMQIIKFGLKETLNKAKFSNFHLCR
jgi:autotransporter-associated beta strand protein